MSAERARRRQGECWILVQSSSLTQGRGRGSAAIGPSTVDRSKGNVGHASCGVELVAANSLRRPRVSAVTHVLWRWVQEQSRAREWMMQSAMACECRLGCRRASRWQDATLADQPISP